MSAHHRLYAAWDLACREHRRSADPVRATPVSPSSPPSSPAPAGAASPFSEIAAPASISARDLAIAQLRAQAVAEYNARKLAGLTETQAAVLTAAEWRARPRTRAVHQTERIRRHRRDAGDQVAVGPFSESTLRRWVSTWDQAGRRIESLAPARAGRAGRARVEIPEQLLDIIQAFSCSTARADISSAIDRARDYWPGAWPDCSYATIVRRIRERDPAQSHETLGRRGIASFRADHAPDIERDWNLAAYNEEWQLDDITEDFYAHGADPRHILRPYAYAIIRAATRQWVAAVTTETPIPADLVRPLVGLALADPRGGIPERIRFERGAVACDAYLEDTLESLGIQVCRTSMDGGAIAPGAFADRATGHFQGKGVVESNIRLHHRHNAYAAGQVGPDERRGPARTETLKSYAAACAKAGQPSVLPTAGEWRKMIFSALTRHNDRPHGSLPQIVLEDGSTRHQTPNERAAQLIAEAAEPVRVMPEVLLPLFYDRGLRLPVTRNGVRLQGVTYGRWDDALHERQGQAVTVYAAPEIPGAVYVEELGRCIDADDPVAPGAEGDLIAKKRRLEKQRRNKFEQLIARADAAVQTVAEETRILAGPIPARIDHQAAPQLLERARVMREAAASHKSKRTASRARYDFSGTGDTCVAPSAAPSNRRGLLANADRLTAQSRLGPAPGPRAADRFTDITDIFQEPAPTAPPVGATSMSPSVGATRMSPSVGATRKSPSHHTGEPK